MARRRGNKPIEKLRTAWTSTADLEASMALMFNPGATRPAVGTAPGVPTEDAVPSEATVAVDETAAGGTVPELITVPLERTAAELSGVDIGQECVSQPATVPNVGTVPSEAIARESAPGGEATVRVLTTVPSERTAAELAGVDLGHECVSPPATVPKLGTVPGEAVARESAPGSEATVPVLTTVPLDGTMAESCAVDPGQESASHPTAVPSVGTVPAVAIAGESASGGATVPVMTTVPSDDSGHEFASHPTPVPSVGTVPAVRISKARTAQDGHTVWEQVIYDNLWRQAAPSAAGYREISMGYRHIAASTRLGLKTVQRNMKSLQQKLTLEPVGRYDSDTRTPKTYRVYSPEAIMDRRKQVGLEWVAVNRQGVTLTTGATLGTVLAAAADPILTGLYGEVAALLRLHLAAEDASVRMLVERCREEDSSATAGEICHFVEVKIGLHRPTGNEKELVAMLVDTVPKCFSGTMIQEYREQVRRHQEQGREEARRVLEDPQSTDSERELARSMLGACS